jgi:hypothetical protein
MTIMLTRVSGTQICQQCAMQPERATCGEQGATSTAAATSGICYGLVKSDTLSSITVDPYLQCRETRPMSQLIL